MALILDTGPLLAALDAADPDHERCAALLTEADEDLVVPSLVMAELDYWCHERLGTDAWLVFLDDLVRGANRVEPPVLSDLQRQYDDLGLGVVDASIVALAERLGERRLATLDRRHFTVVRPARAESF